MNNNVSKAKKSEIMVCDEQTYGRDSKDMKLEVFHNSQTEVDSSPMISEGAFKDEELSKSPLLEHDTSIASPQTNLGPDHLDENIRYVTNRGEQTVAFVYPRSALPLLSTNGQGYVNIVELPHVDGVDGTLHLNNSLEYHGSVVLQNAFENDNRITVMASNVGDGQIRLIEAHDIDSNEDESVTYLRSADVSSLDNDSGDNGSSILSEQLISIPTTEVVTKLTDGNTITLPISFVSESVEVSLLRSLRHLPITLNSGETTLSMPVTLQSDYVTHEKNSDTQTQEFILPADLTTRHEKSTCQTPPKLCNKSLNKNYFSHAKPATKLAVRPVGVQVGRPPKSQRKKFIGSGPTAISAQGVVQEIGNRLVTVLPRPEDLQKLLDNKQFVLTVRGSNIKGKRKVKNNSLCDISRNHKKKMGTLHIKHSRHLPEKQQKDSIIDMNISEGCVASCVYIGEIDNKTDYLDKDFTPQALYKPRKRKKKRGRGKCRKEEETVVISSSGRRPGRPKKVKTLIQGSNGPKLIQTGRITQQEDMEVDEKYPSLSSEQCKEGQNFHLTNPDTVRNKNEDSYVSSNNRIEAADLKVNYANEKAVDYEDSTVNKLTEIRRKLPPRNRGAKYQKMIEILKKSDYDDDDFIISSEDETNDGYLANNRRPFIPIKQKGSSGPGKRGRPRKIVPVDLNYNNGTKIIKLSESLKPIESTNSSVVLIRDENVGNGNMANLQHRLVITFEQPDTGEMVMQQISVQNSDNKSDEILESRLMTDPLTNITLVQSSQGNTEDETATIFVGEDGKYKQGFQCEECGETTLYKRDHIRHLRQKHNLKMYDCVECKKGFTSKQSLKEHSNSHGFVKPHVCNLCGEGFHAPSLLKSHMNMHSSETTYHCDHCSKIFTNISHFQQHVSEEIFTKFSCDTCTKVFDSKEQLNEHPNCLNKVVKYFICDICNVKFITSSGLNRHRKVHDRSNSEESLKEYHKCSICYATFSYQSSLSEHVKVVHEDLPESIDHIRLPTTEKQEQEDKVIERLQDKLNEGYAPKTSELYDVPKEDETIETASKDPFLCGICDDPFKDIDQLCDHYTSCHMGDQAVYCNICSVGCRSISQMEKHKLIHTCEENKTMSVPACDLDLICTLCNKNFSTTIELNKHLKMHGQEKQFRCNFCNAKFLIKSALDKHILVHTGQRPFLCDICLKSFRQSAALVRHKLWTHKLKNQNKCELCGKTFFTLNILLNHLDVHGDEGIPLRNQLLMKKDEDKSLDKDLYEEEDSYLKTKSALGSKLKVCEYCGKECTSLVALLTHKITHKHSASYKCDQCHRTFREKKYLKKHKLTHKGLKTWQCDICSKSFATKLTLIRHSHVHLREALRPDINVSVSDKETNFSLTDTLPSDLKCEECNLCFSHKSHFVRHKLLHSGIPLLKCGLCDKMFVHKSDIIRHKVMHSLMFTCNICGRNFHKRSLYIMHKKRHLDARPFKCDKCCKSFSTSGNFKTHLRIHSGEKPFQCNICSYRCSQSGRLLKHKQMHSGEKTSSCTYCGKCFANAESAKSHQRLHTGERPFKCNECQKSFINNASLNLHMRDHFKEQLYKCENCHHKFRRSDHLEKHKLFHQMQLHYQQNKAMGIDGDSDVDNPLYMCDICGRVFDRKKYLYTHHNVHSRQKVYTCSLCLKQLASRLALKNHLMIHSGEMPHKCNICEKVFRNLSNLKRHGKVHCTQEMLNCEECGETFYSSHLLKEHKQAHVNLMMINSHVDSVDGEVSQQLYVFDDAISDAMDTTQQLLVNNSQQQFLVENSQSLLVFSESGNESYDIVTAPPTSNGDAIPDSPPPAEDTLVSSPDGTHVRDDEEDDEMSVLPLSTVKIECTPLHIEETEDGEDDKEQEVIKPHQCEFCPKSFAKKQYLTKHKYRHREVKPHGCDICGKRFAQKFEVAVHKIRHTGERPYRCNFCSKDFRSKVNLTNHEMRHTGEYPYLCSVCNKGLSTQLQLERHVSLHTGAHPFRCEICKKGFFQEMSLLRHLTKAHNIQAMTDFQNVQPLENTEAAEQMEVMEAISTISNNPPMVNNKHSMAELSIVNKKKHLVKEDNELHEDDDTLEIGIVGDLTRFEEGQPEYFKTCLLDNTPSDINSKLFTIFQRVRVEDENIINDR